MPLPPDARANWALLPPDDPDARAVKHGLVQETKRLVELVALLDVADADDGEIDDLRGQVADLADRLAKLPSLAARGGLAVAGPPDSTLAERSGISGRSNPLAPPLEIHVDGDVTRGSAVYSAAYEGPPGVLHGGFVAAAFDDLLGVAQQTSGKAGYTGTLTVRMRRPTPLGPRIDYEAGVKEIRGRKIVCWGRSTAGGEVLAEAEALFIAPADGSLPGAPG
jgi:acyl-coenzyme A thioesterase PaaI-like protein